MATNGLRPEQKLDLVIVWLDDFQRTLVNHENGEAYLERYCKALQELALIRIAVWGEP